MRQCWRSKRLSFLPPCIDSLHWFQTDHDANSKHWTWKGISVSLRSPLLSLKEIKGIFLTCPMMKMHFSSNLKGHKTHAQVGRNCTIVGYDQFISDWFSWQLKPDKSRQRTLIDSAKPPFENIDQGRMVAVLFNRFYSEKVQIHPWFFFDREISSTCKSLSFVSKLMDYQSR